MSEQQYKPGIRRDGSYYTRIEWASHTVSDPQFWVVNLIRDDLERNGGTWGANTRGPANVILSFFGESQPVTRFRIFQNVGASVSILEELVKTLRIYISNSDAARNLRTAEDDIEAVDWVCVKEETMIKEEAWQEIVLDAPVMAKYVRFELVENHGTPEGMDWVETNEIKIYGN